MKKVIHVTIAACIILLTISGVNVFADSQFSQQLQQKLSNAVVLFVGSSKAYANNNQTVVDTTSENVYPFIKDGRTLVPARFISENLGAEVDWNDSLKLVTVTLDGRIVQLTIGRNIINDNGEIKAIDVPAQIVGERTFIPLRALVEALGKKVFWDDRGLIVISNSENILEDTNQVDEVVSAFLKKGNSVGNIVNGGLVSQQGEWIYYSNNNDYGSLYKVRSDGSDKTKLNDDTSYYINVVDNWIYYSSFGAGGKQIVKMNIDGSNKTTVSEDAAISVYVIGDWIYYINKSDNDSIYKIKTNGAENTKVSGDRAGFINVIGQYVYYTNAYDKYKIYRIKTDGSNKTKIVEDESAFINVAGDWIYYGKTDEGMLGAIYKVKTDGTNRTLLVNSSYHNINIEGDWIIYSNKYGNSQKSRGIYKIRTDGTGKSRLNDDETYSLNIAGGWIYNKISQYPGDRGFYKMRLDGTERKDMN